MSAMPEESDADTAEDGSLGPDSDGASDKTTEVHHTEQPERTSLDAADTVRKEDEPRGLELGSEPNGAVLSGYRRINNRDGSLADETAEVVPRQGTERSSSADGSLSTADDIPDDTPSLKVCHVHSHTSRTSAQTD